MEKAMEYLAEITGVVVVLIYAVALPAVLTLWNTYHFFARKRRHPEIALLLTVGVGLVDYGLLFSLIWNTAGDYHQQIYNIQVHNPIASDYCLSFALPIALGLAGLLVLGLVPVRKLPPLVSAIATAWVVLGNILGLVFAVQIWSWEEMPQIIWLYLFHFNMLVLSATHICWVMGEQVEILKERKGTFRHGWMVKLYPLISTVSRMGTFYFLMLFPMAGILEIILVLFGQGAGGVVRAFTMTADWNFSTQIPPPPLAYDGHYLCTVAAGGHRKVVKPIRFGMRRGDRIIVNRQLCIANAFEELIRERLPRFHRRVRHFYDSHGYPISRLIDTPWKADAVYFMMKPLEWMFLMVLYLVDAEPEERIARQYPINSKMN